MGSFYVNFAVRSENPTGLVSALVAAGRDAFVSSATGGFVFVVEKTADQQGEREVVAMAELLSRFSGATLAVLNHDDDILMYWLCVSGVVVDKYNSYPGYFTDGADTPTGSDALKLCEMLGRKEHAGQAASILRAGNDLYVFALERHEELAKVLGLPWPICATGYRHVTNGDVNPSIDGAEWAKV